MSSNLSYLKEIFLLFLLFNNYFVVMQENEFKADETEKPHHHQHHPHILSGNINITSYEGETVTLPCEVSNLDDHHVIWLKMENEIPLTLTVGYEQFSRNMRYRVVRLTDTQQASDNGNNNKIESWNFEIRKVNKDDRGLYQCFIKINSKHRIKANIYLDVLNEKEKANESPMVISSNLVSDRSQSDQISSLILAQNMERIEIPKHSWIKLRCNSTQQSSTYKSLIRNNKNIQDIQWYKDGQLIEPDTRRLRKSSSTDANIVELEIFSIDISDSGIYQCKKNARVLKNIFLNVSENSGFIKLYNFYLMILLLTTAAILSY